MSPFTRAEREAVTAVARMRARDIADLPRSEWAALADDELSRVHTWLGFAWDELTRHLFEGDDQ